MVNIDGEALRKNDIHHLAFTPSTDRNHCFIKSSLLLSYLKTTFMKTTLYIQNLKCSGCEHTIIKELMTIGGIKDVFINIEDSSVTFRCKLVGQIDDAVNKLSRLGYPVLGNRNSLGARAKSYVSCAIGKLTKK